MSITLKSHITSCSGYEPIFQVVFTFLENKHEHTYASLWFAHHDATQLLIINKLSNAVNNANNIVCTKSQHKQTMNVEMSEMRKCFALPQCHQMYVLYNFESMTELSVDKMNSGFTMAANK